MTLARMHARIAEAVAEARLDPYAVAALARYAETVEGERP